jgi:hypothetical protein
VSISRARWRGARTPREAGELAASEECARWFRKIEPPNVIGNLGPLASRARSGAGRLRRAGPVRRAGEPREPVWHLRALPHAAKLLAVLLLTVFGFYRTKIDRVCNRAMSLV